VIGLGRWCQSQGAPEPRDPIPCLSPELPLSANINRRVRPELQTEQIRVLSGIGSTRKVEEVRNSIGLDGGRLD